MVNYPESKKKGIKTEEPKPEIATAEQYQLRMAELQQREAAMAAEMVKLKEEAAVAYKTAKKAAFEAAIKSVDTAVVEAYTKFDQIRSEIGVESSALQKLRDEGQAILAKINLLTASQQPYYKPVRDALTGKVAEDVLDEFLGKAPEVKVVKEKSAESGERKSRTAVIIDGVKMTWTEASEKYNIPVHVNANQRPYAEKGLAAKGIKYTEVVASTGEVVQ